MPLVVGGGSRVWFNLQQHYTDSKRCLKRIPEKPSTRKNQLGSSSRTSCKSLVLCSHPFLVSSRRFHCCRRCSFSSCFATGHLLEMEKVLQLRPPSVNPGAQLLEARNHAVWCLGGWLVTTGAQLEVQELDDLRPLCPQGEVTCVAVLTPPSPITYIRNV